MNRSRKKDAVFENEKVVDSSAQPSQPALNEEPASSDSLNEEDEAQKQDTEYVKGWRLYMLTLG